MTLLAGERVTVVGCAHARCERGSAVTHGHRLAPGGEAPLLRSLPDVGSTAVLEGGPDGAVIGLRALVNHGAAGPETAAALRVSTYADAVAAGHATIVTQARPAAACHVVAQLTCCFVGVAGRLQRNRSASGVWLARVRRRLRPERRRQVDTHPSAREHASVSNDTRRRPARRRLRSPRSDAARGCIAVLA